MSDAKKDPPHLVLDQSLAGTAIKSVQKAFTNLFGVTPSPGTVTIQKDFVSKGDVSGILGMVQERIEATLIVSFQKETIFDLLGKMYGQSFTEIDNSIKQGVGELTNIIYASVKKDLNEKGHTFKMSIPSVVIGSSHSIINIHDGKTLVIPFTVNTGSFFLEITLQSA